MKTVNARFGERRQEFSYFVPEGDRPRVGDFIFTSVSLPEVEYQEDISAIEARDIIGNGKLARIVSVSEEGAPRATKFYLQLISASALRDAQERNRQYMERESRRKRAREKLEKMLAEQSARERFGKLAESNAEAAALLAELEG